MRRILLLLFSLNWTYSNAQDSGIAGVVSYYFNEFQGDRPDLGAQVFVVDSVDHPEFNYAILDDFLSAKIYMTSYLRSMETKQLQEKLLTILGNKKRNSDEVNKIRKEMMSEQKIVDFYLSNLYKLNAETTEKYDLLSEKANEVWNMIRLKENIKSKTIDANGNYSISLKSGFYYVIIKSKNRKGINKFEIWGKMYSEKVKIESGQIKDISHNFELD